ncbi:cyclic-di-GMP phosphodiesterase, flagellum assembly factor TipF [uncultured Gammaproteobacteria bacterium]
MTLVIHLIFALTYVIAGVAMAMTLPYMIPALALDFGRLLGWLAGAVIILAGALGHEIIARLERERRLGDRFARLRLANGELASLLVHTREEISALRAAAEAGDLSGATYESVMGEVRLLRAMVGRLTGQTVPSALPALDAARTLPRPLAVEPAQPPAPAAIRMPRPEPPPAVASRNLSEPERQVLDAMRDALRDDRIDVYLQPIVSLPQRKHRYYEVFSRIRDVDGHHLMPDQYLEIAERENLISTIDNILLMRCIQLIRETERRQHTIGFFSNISAATIGDAEFMRQFLQIMARNQSMRPKLVFELGQPELTVGGATTLAILDQLARIGFRFSIDQVERLDIDVDNLVSHEFRYLKIDCARLLDPGQKSLVKELRRRLDGQPIDLIVEKIETEQQLAVLLDMGIDFGQGYLFGEPRLSRKPS